MSVTGYVTAPNLYATNKIGINTISPKYTLDCRGNGSFGGTLNVIILVASSSITSNGVINAFKYLELTNDTSYRRNIIIQVGNSQIYSAVEGTTTCHL